MLAAPILGAAVARLAVWVQNFRSPLLIFPLLVGCGLGLVLVGLMRLGQVGHRATLWSGAMLAVAVAVAGQHYFSFLDAKAALAAQKPQDLPLEAFQEFQETRLPDADRPILHGSCSDRRPGAARDCGICASRRGRLGELGPGRPADAAGHVDDRLPGLPGPVLQCLPQLVSHDPRRPVGRRQRPGGWPKRRRCRSRNRLAHGRVSAFPLRRRLRTEPAGVGLQWPSEDQGRGSMALGRPARASGAGAGWGNDGWGD